MPPPAPRPLVLMILDGFGVNPETKWNAVAIARMPHYRRLLERFPHSTLDASESFVGLPKGFMGNSEVGHLNIGAGRVVYQDFSLISKAIEDGSFLKNAALCEVMNGCRALHLMGLVSDGGVHSHLSHCLALIDMAKRQGVKKIWIHAFTDGRDTSPTSGCGFVKTIEDYAKASGVARIATILGRFYAMDRDKRWERTEAAYRAIVEARGPRFEKGADYVKAAYANTGDEFIDPGVAADYSGVQEGDGVIFFNFRADRARQLSRAMTSREFREFERSNVNLSGFVCMTPYDSTLGLPYAFEKAKIRNTLGEIVGQKGWKQLRIAETEKYAHVTYFFNGGEEREFPGEKRILVPSPRDVKTYDLKPEMAAREVTEKLMRELESGQYRFLVVNFANPDMVGHTGLMNAAVRALEVVDECVGRVVAWIERSGALGILTADHGNCEKMMGDDGEPLTSHTLFPVPFIVIDPLRKPEVKAGGRLCDIAPTILALWGVPQPAEMTGNSLIGSR